MEDTSTATSPSERAPGMTGGSEDQRVILRFALRTGAVLVALGIAMHLLLASTVTSHFRDQVDFHAEFVARVVVAPMLEDPTMGMSALEGGLTDEVQRDGQVLSVGVERDGRLVATDRASMPDERSTSPTGIVITRVTVDDPEGGEAVVRVTQDWRPFQQDAAGIVRRLDAIVGLGLLVLWAVLLPLAGRLGRRLRARADELEAQRQTLARLLEREQETVERLEELGQLRDGVVTAVSHEVRTPLTVAAGALQTLTEDGDKLDDERRQGLLDAVRRNVDRLRRLLEGLLDLDVMADDHAPRKEPVDLERALTAARAGLEVDVNQQLEARVVEADARHVERILALLLDNAQHHAGTPVTVRSVRTDEGVELRVADRGPGIPRHLHQAVFEPLRHGSNVSTHAPGLGIGLALVARLAARMGGRAWVTDNTGGGAVFHVLLAAPEVSGLPEDPSDREGGGRSPRRPTATPVGGG